MTNHLVKVDPSTRIHHILTEAAAHKYGHGTSVSIWLTETGPHGASYYGFDYTRGAWVQVNLDFNVTK